MNDKTIFIAIGVLMIVAWTFREGMKALRSGTVEKTVKGAKEPLIISRTTQANLYWSYVITWFGVSVGTLLAGIWLVFIK
ncbi:DUF2542 domain-containing protein [Citrobacter amalonaticus]|uniref:DUF2542 domain-containing protein n=1 Tax=Citrobacter amalonaticus TaxID=35703 RepID=A0A2S4S322_CITAM|nr:DUF2542 family protein [Citrobacter amalonaticus]POT59675.1 DUF2542 domain-containing protein [Citrobacter amalonaticus]POT77805.1 DUF2542 domain-containing protein [Citrobacter amalonaticus]POU68257.1 DUF2542 domain-containing protein [Citrobacter amalonaticus]POV07860.1 DUF2542 domain-containing protein [Citrobacter amalonaticus]